MVLIVLVKINNKIKLTQHFPKRFHKTQLDGNQTNFLIMTTKTIGIVWIKIYQRPPEAVDKLVEQN